MTLKFQDQRGPSAMPAEHWISTLLCLVTLTLRSFAFSAPIWRLVARQQADTRDCTRWETATAAASELSSWWVWYFSVLIFQVRARVSIRSLRCAYHRKSFVWVACLGWVKPASAWPSVWASCQSCTESPGSTRIAHLASDWVPFQLIYILID